MTSGSAAANAGPGPSAPLRVAVLASGRGSNFSALLEASRSGWLAISLVGVFSDKPAAEVLERARAAGLPATALPPREFANRAAHEVALFAALEAVQPDLIVCAGYMRVIGASALQGRSHRMINIHPSLLPKYRGLHTHQRALEAGDAEHGASVHFVTAELDGGPVLAQARVAVRPDDTADTLALRVLGREHRLLCTSVALFAERRVALSSVGIQLDGRPLAAPLQLDPNDRLLPAEAA